jgi:hypothetical protein
MRYSKQNSCKFTIDNDFALNLLFRGLKPSISNSMLMKAGKTSLIGFLIKVVTEHFWNFERSLATSSIKRQKKLLD